jgi:hypothetical protein
VGHDAGRAGARSPCCRGLRHAVDADELEPAGCVPPWSRRCETHDSAELDVSCLLLPDATGCVPDPRAWTDGPSAMPGVGRFRQYVARRYSPSLLFELRTGFRERLEGAAHLSGLSVEAGGLGTPRVREDRGQPLRSSSRQGARREALGSGRRAAGIRVVVWWSIRGIPRSSSSRMRRWAGWAASGPTQCRALCDVRTRAQA